MVYTLEGVHKETSFTKKFMIAAGAMLVASGVYFASAFAAPSPLLCFSGTEDGGYYGTCVLSSDGMSAVVNTNDADADPNNAYGGVYYAETTLSGKMR